MNERHVQTEKRCQYVKIIAIVAIVLVQLGCRSREAESVRSTEELSGTSLIQLTDTNFQRIVSESDQPVLVDMWAPWCQPCIEMKPLIHEIAEELVDKVVVAELDVSENPFIKEKYDVKLYPMLLIFDDGVEIRRLIGIQSKRALLDVVSEFTKDCP